MRLECIIESRIEELEEAISKNDSARNRITHETLITNYQILININNDLLTVKESLLRIGDIRRIISRSYYV